MLSAPMYAKFQVESWDAPFLADMYRGDLKVDAYCVTCKRDSIFFGTSMERVQSLGYEDLSWVFGGQYLTAQAACGRCKSVYFAAFLAGDDFIIKVGQNPSIEDLSSANDAKYRKILEKSEFVELRKAVGLFSHGIGIGSFVYLRRLFEALVNRHREELEKINGPIAGWNEMRMADRIKALESSLPPLLVTHRKAYGILSAGVHELSEDECRKYFPVVRTAIIQILEQDLRIRDERIAEQELLKQLAQIETEVAQIQRG